MPVESCASMRAMMSVRSDVGVGARLVGSRKKRLERSSTRPHFEDSPSGPFIAGARQSCGSVRAWLWARAGTYIHFFMTRLRSRALVHCTALISSANQLAMSRECRNTRRARTRAAAPEHRYSLGSRHTRPSLLPLAVCSLSWPLARPLALRSSAPCNRERGAALSVGGCARACRRPDGPDERAHAHRTRSVSSSMLAANCSGFVVPSGARVVSVTV